MPSNGVQHERPSSPKGLLVTHFREVNLENARPFRKRRRGEGPSTGLRAVTMAVIKRLKVRQVCTYTDMASMICHEINPHASSHEKTNMRRRAYDVINVMSAVGLLRKKDKRLFSVESFIGANTEELKRDIDERKKRIERKEQELDEMLKYLETLGEVKTEEEDSMEKPKSSSSDGQRVLEDLVMWTEEDYPYNSSETIHDKENCDPQDLKPVIVEPVNQWCSVSNETECTMDRVDYTTPSVLIVDENVSALNPYQDVLGGDDGDDQFFDCIDSQVLVTSQNYATDYPNIQQTFASFY
jgi:hypothetical protein